MSFQWFTDWIEQVKDKQIIVQSVAILWTLWLDRNKLVFNQSYSTTESILGEARKPSDMVSSNSKRGSGTCSDHVCHISNTTSNLCILQNERGNSNTTKSWMFIIDGSWKSATENAGIAWICLDHNMQQIKQQATV